MSNKAARIAQDRRDESLHGDAKHARRANEKEQLERVALSGRDPAVKVSRMSDLPKG